MSWTQLYRTWCLTWVTYSKDPGEAVGHVTATGSNFNDQQWSKELILKKKEIAYYSTATVDLNISNSSRPLMSCLILLQWSCSDHSFWCNECKMNKTKGNPCYRHLTLITRLGRISHELFEVSDGAGSGPRVKANYNLTKCLTHVLTL